MRSLSGNYVIEDWLKDLVFRPDKRRPLKNMEAVFILQVLLGQNWGLILEYLRQIFFFLTIRDVHSS